MSSLTVPLRPVTVLTPTIIMHISILALVLLLAACVSPSDAGAPLVEGGSTPHTRRLGDAAPSGATVADLEFLVGRWVGEAFGGVAEETWNPVLGGEMIGTFRLISDGQPVFSEILTLVEEEGRVIMRLKHFHPGLIGWEEKADSVVFPLVAVSGSTAWFSGLTFHRQGDELIGYLAMSHEGEVTEEVFRYRRVAL